MTSAFDFIAWFLFCFLTWFWVSIGIPPYELENGGREEVEANEQEKKKNSGRMEE